MSDVYDNNYLMQCLKVIYADGNRSLIHQRQLSPWYITQSLQEFQARSVLHPSNAVHDFTFCNFEGLVWQDASHLVSWYVHCAVLSGVCCEMQRKWGDFFTNIRDIFNC